jgi:16S rRNA G1207 methylase RsmC
VPEHYFTPAPSSDDATHEIPLRVDGRDLVLLASAGVFSGAHVDGGTKVLLDHAPAPPASGTLLDLGCGYGPIACWLAVKSPAATVVAVDVNARALDLTRRNTAAFDNVVVATDHPGPYDRIYSNPPIRIGKTALHTLLTTWLARLAPQGIAYLVVQKNLGSDSLLAWLVEGGWQAIRLTSVRGFRILEVRR